MIDLHCHILPGVDDGSRNMEDTIALLKKAKNAGFDTICFTPHYAEPQYLHTKNENQEILEQVQARINEENLDINLFLGNEIFIRQNMKELFEEDKITTLGGTQYALIELPMFQELPQEVVQNMLEPIKQGGIKVVIAHPERYTYIQRNPKKISEYFDDEIIFQSNYGSIIGAYGREAQKTIKKLLKEKAIHYFSSDVHHISRCFYDDFEVIKKKMLKAVDEEYFEILTETNPRLVIENKEIKNERE